MSDLQKTPLEDATLDECKDKFEKEKQTFETNFSSYTELESKSAKLSRVLKLNNAIQWTDRGNKFIKTLTPAECDLFTGKTTSPITSIIQADFLNPFETIYSYEGADTDLEVLKKLTNHYEELNPKYQKMTETLNSIVTKLMSFVGTEEKEAINTVLSE